MMNFEIIHVEQLGSTNKTAFELIEKGVVNEGVVVLADEQTSGRGYGHNKWESEKQKNLTCSLVLCPDFILPADQFVITQVVSVALINLLKKIIPETDLKIKWPNDIYAGDKKIAGMLIQNIIKGREIDYSVIGIGLNVNQEIFHSNAPNPVSIIHYTGKNHNVEKLLKKLLSEIDVIYSRVSSYRYLDQLQKAYLKNLYRVEEWAIYKHKDQKFRAKLNGVGSFGRLILQLEDGEKRMFDFKEVEFLI